MNKIFKIVNGFVVQDGTQVFPFLNSKDCMSDLPFDLVEGFSIAAGEIFPLSRSKIHLMPLVTQVTFVLDGNLSIYMKDKISSEQYKLELEKHEAIVTQPGTFFQLVNETKELCRVLYIVSPDYLYDKVDNKVVYDDAIVLNEDWEQLSQLNWNPLDLLNSNITPESRQVAYEKIKLKKNIIK